MIEFKGEISEESKKFLLKTNALLGLIVGVVIAVIFIPITIIISVHYSLWIITVFLIPIMLTVLLAIISPFIQKEKTIKMLIPKKISIDNESIFYDLENASVNKSLNSVKRVVDYGEWYLIKLKFPKVGGFLCQKNLITKGTIEDFEKIFDTKIVLKNK